jgi:hypothetical protein
MYCMQGSSILRTLGPRMLLLDAGALTLANMPMSVPAYQHLYQELGYIGYYHSRMDMSTSKPKAEAMQGNRKALSGVAGKSGPRCRVCASGPDTLLPPLRLGFVSPYTSQKPPSWRLQ